MNIVTEKSFKDRLSDGIDTILNMSEDDFNRVIDMLTIEPNKKIEDFIYLFYSTDDSKYPEKSIELGAFQKNERGYRHSRDGCYSITDFFSQLESYMSNTEQNSDKYIRCSKIISTRNIDTLKKYFQGKNGEYSELTDKLFDVLIIYLKIYL